MQYVFAVAALALFLPVLVSASGHTESGADERGILSLAGKVQLFGFTVFEGCVGMFWPSIMKMRSVYVPEEMRSTIINIFRMPLNLFVCTVLYNVSLRARNPPSGPHLTFASASVPQVNMFSTSTYFGMCSGFLLLAAYFQIALYRTSLDGKSIKQGGAADV